LKVNSQPNSPDYKIAKLLLNSLYGRFGMHPEKEIHKIVTNKQSAAWIEKYEVTNVIDFKNGKELISFFDRNNIREKSNTSLNISIPISTAVTS
jgi:DNA polymerase type B, organellar and viral